MRWETPSFTSLLLSLLQMEDRSAAAFGLENRSPFLDCRLIELAFSIPADMKIRGSTLKWILREVAARYLPKKVLDRRDKMGLVFPASLWFKWSGRRGEFDHHFFNELSMKVWRVFFSGTHGGPAVRVAAMATQSSPPGNGRRPSPSA